MTVSLGERIKMKRKELGFTQSDISGPNLSRGMISLIERNKTAPSIKVITVIADKLGITVQELLDENMQKKEGTTTFNEDDVKRVVRRIQALINSNKIEQAENLINETLPLIDIVSPSKGTLLKSLAFIKQTYGNLDSSIQLYNEALYYISPHEIEDHIEIYSGLAQNYRKNQNWGLCIENALYASILIKSNFDEDKRNLLIHLDILYNLAYSYSKTKDVELALKTITKALNIMKSKGVNYLIGSFYALKGLSELLLNKIEEGIKSTYMALENELSEENKIGCLTNLGILYRNKGLYEKSIKKLIESTNLSAENYPLLYMNNCYELSVTYKDNFEYSKAKEISYQTLSFKTEEKNLIKGKIHFLLSELSLEENCISETEKHLNMSIEIFKFLNDKYNLAKCYYLKAQIMGVKNKTSTSNKYYKRAFEVLLNENKS